MALNGGPHYRLTPAISLYVDCEDQEEVDALWAKLGQGGAPQACGWITDRFGLSWQIIPRALTQLMGDKDPVKAQRVMQAMLKMVKIDVGALRRAYDGRDA
jgi:predicted 3-demethylubiquinone-9 3-methyltransferase (glyoxalase superfamily)